MRVVVRQGFYYTGEMSVLLECVTGGITVGHVMRDMLGGTC